MTDKELQEMADIYGLYTEEDVKIRLRYETAGFQRRLDIIQGFLDRDEEYIKLKNELKNKTYVVWHYPSSGELPEPDVKEKLLFYVKEYSDKINDYYRHFAIGVYKHSFMFDEVNIFEEQSKGYSCEHLPETVIAWQYISLPEDCQKNTENKKEDTNGSNSI